MTTTNEVVRERRAKLGLTELEVARRADLTPSEYFDVELHEDEAFKVVQLRNLRKLCEVLQLDLLDLFGIGCAMCGSSGAPVASARPRSEVVRARRRELGMSEEELADRIGFEAIAVRDMEKDPHYLDSWSVELVLNLAAVLSVPAQALLGVKCSKCGR